MSMPQGFEQDVDDLDFGEQIGDEDLDLAEEDDTEPAAQPETAAQEASITPAAPTRTGDPSRAKAFARRVAAKAVQLTAADTDDLAVLSALLGVTGDAVDLTVAVMTGDRTAITVAADVERIAAADPFSAAVTAQETGRTRMRAVAGLLHALGETASATLNGSDAKAAVAVAQGVHRMSAAARARLAHASALARRTV